MNEHRLPTLTKAETVLVEQLNQIGDKQAANRLTRTGLPTRRIESYHYTDLHMLIRDVPALVKDEAVTTQNCSFALSNSFCINLNNANISDSEKAPVGIFVANADGSGLAERDDGLVSLNRAFVNKSLLVRLEGKVEEILHLQRHVYGDAVHVAGSVVLDVAAGAQVVVLETFEGSDAAHMENYSTRVNLGAGAKLTHIIVDQSSKSATHFHTIEYEIGADVTLRNLIVNSGSGLSRVQMFGQFSGEGAHADLTGLNMVDDGQHCDITMDMTHGAENTTAQELFKSVVRNRAKAIFQGRILVEPQAQKTDAKMMAQGLMLSEGAQILTKPELEIFADDVQCGHGCTCGELDAGALFYLMSRGIGREDASSMLIRAFIQELLDPIEDQELNEKLSAIVTKWLEKGSAD